MERYYKDFKKEEKDKLKGICEKQILRLKEMNFRIFQLYLEHNEDFIKANQDFLKGLIPVERLHKKAEEWRKRQQEVSLSIQELKGGVKE